MSVTEKLVGTSQRKQDGHAMLTGRARYSGDISLPATAHMAVVRSPVAHAALHAVDLSAAAAQPGVLAVLDGRAALALAGPIPHNLDPAGLGGHHADVRCLAVDRVRFVGEPIAAIVADTPGDARAAARLVTAQLDPLPFVLDAREALAADAPLLYDDWGTNEMIQLQFGDGEFDAAAAAAGHVLEGTLDVQRTTSAPIEPRTYLADWDANDGRLTWYGTTQNPHPMRWVLARALGLEESQIRVVAPRSGGAFGLKMHGHPEEILVAALSRMLGRPVRWVEDRAECMLAGGREQHHRFRVAYDEDGRIHGVEDHIVANHGAAAAGPGWGMAFVGSVSLTAGYDIQTCRVTTQVAVTNKSGWTGMRGFGKETATTVMERIVDLVAAATGIDPVEVRRRNLVQADRFPYTTATGLSLDSGDYHGLLDKVLERLDHPAALREQAALREAGRHIGIGIAFELTPEGADIPGALVGGMDTTTVKMNPSGEVTVLTGVTSPGSGNDTAIAQIVADALGVGLDAVGVVQGDSTLCPYGYGNLSSRSVIAGGGSALLAAQDIAAKLRAVAAAMFHIDDADRVVLSGGMAVDREDHAHAVPVPAVAHAVYTLGYILALGIEPTLEATRTYRPPNIRHLPDDKGRISPFHSFGNAVHASVVEVDAQTGDVTLRRHVVGHDCGTVINPGFVDGQVQGSVCTGIGIALGEELVHDESGTLLTDGFKTYLMPRATDMPELELCHQVTPSPYTAFGAKGAGESGMGGAQAAILNAVNDALRPLGADVARLPLSAPTVLAAIRAAAG